MSYSTKLNTVLYAIIKYRGKQRVNDKKDAR